MPKYLAHLAVQRALISGALERQACEVCGVAKVDAHRDREHSGRECLREIPVIQLVTSYSDEIENVPFVQRVLKPAARPCPIVGNLKRGLIAPHTGISHLDTKVRDVVAAITAKPEQVAEGDAARARQYMPTRYDRRREKGRRMRFREAVAFAYAMDWPLNIGLTITWTALQTAGERNEGHCLGRDEWDREKYTRDELARLCRSEGLPFAALWGRDIGADMGSHVHLAMFWPSYELARLVAMIERISGSSADFVLTPYASDVVARSVCGGWQINMNTRKDDKASALEWAEYITAQHAKHPAPSKIKGKAFGISETIGKAAQERARALLEAREARYGWIRAAVAASAGAPR